MLCNSWVITEKATGRAVLETYNKNVIDAINTDKYRVETSHDYLCGIATAIKNREDGPWWIDKNRKG